jgi:hypothetical protein
LGGIAKRSDLRSLIFTDSVLDYLVHRHVLRSGSKPGYRPLPFKEFTQILHDRYGFCVDRAPPAMTVSNELLRLNRVVLERRLRDLGGQYCTPIHARRQAVVGTIDGTGAPCTRTAPSLPTNSTGPHSCSTTALSWSSAPRSMIPPRLSVVPGW